MNPRHAQGDGRDILSPIVTQIKQVWLEREMKSFKTALDRVSVRPRWNGQSIGMLVLTIGLLLHGCLAIIRKRVPH